MPRLHEQLAEDVLDLFHHMKGYEDWYHGLSNIDQRRLPHYLAVAIKNRLDKHEVFVVIPATNLEVTDR